MSLAQALDTELDFAQAELACLYFCIMHDGCERCGLSTSLHPKSIMLAQGLALGPSSRRP